MQHDPVRVSETRSWLLKVSNDLRGAEVDLAADPPLTGDAMFHCQQAVEKALKAFLTWHDEPFRKTHDLHEVGNQCVALDGSLAALLLHTVSLTQYAWRFRYPGDPVEPTAEQAADALTLAREVVAAIHSRLPAETHP